MSRKWLKSDTDAMLDDYFSGGYVQDIADNLEVHFDEIKRRVRRFFLNDGGRAESYQSVSRHSRIGKPLHKREQKLIAAHQALGLLPKVTAKVLQRREDEVNPDWQRKAQVQEARAWASSLDLFLACRYARLKWQEKIVNDDTYATMEHEEREFGGNSTPLDMFTRTENMPERIVFLALYLSNRIKDTKRDKELAKLFPGGRAKV